jgi:hypothetical protein
MSSTITRRVSTSAVASARANSVSFRTFSPQSIVASADQKSIVLTGTLNRSVYATLRLNRDLNSAGYNDIMVSLREFPNPVPGAERFLRSDEVEDLRRAIGRSLSSTRYLPQEDRLIGEFLGALPLPFRLHGT